MNSDLITQIFEVCLIPLLGVLTTYLVNYLKAKKIELVNKIEKDDLNKYTIMLFDIVSTCVVATNQTYVESLKEQGKFDKEAQKIAFNKTYEAVIKLLSDEAKQYLSNVFGDLEVYITKLIEENVNSSKKVI